MTSNWIDGRTMALNELCGRFNLPREEAQSFLNSVRVYPQGEEIIHEGDNDRMLYVLRHGVVDVYKRVAPGERNHIATIEALNIFGEMSLVNDEPRNATKGARSDEVLVYAVGRPNLSLILGNARWAEMLVTRLSRNLAQGNARLIETTQAWREEQARRRGLEELLEQRQREHQQALGNVARAFALLLQFQDKVQEHAVVGSRGWAYLRALNRVTHKLIRTFVPGAAGNLPEVSAAELQPYLADLFGTRELDPKQTEE